MALCSRGSTMAPASALVMETSSDSLVRPIIMPPIWSTGSAQVAPPAAAMRSR